MSAEDDELPIPHRSHTNITQAAILLYNSLNKLGKFETMSHEILPCFSYIEILRLLDPFKWHLISSHDVINWVQSSVTVMSQLNGKQPANYDGR
jgi:hypothetical protein